jgi:Ca2+-binding RTX toxin-like protein
MATHEGWPPISLLLMNKDDSTRPLDARPGHDPFGGDDPSYSCDTVHQLSESCEGAFRRRGDGFVIASRPGHAELLGGHGSDVVHGSPWGDVLWGDFNPSGQPHKQHDRLYGGAGPDFIYASHGHNVIEAGAGDDAIHGHFGHGRVDCGPGRDVLYVSGNHPRRWKSTACEVVSRATGQSAPRWLLKTLPWR